jgi:GNAT superfamily N-acetyltransferase
VVDVPTCRMCGAEMRGSVCCWSCTSRGRERCLPFGRQLKVRTSCEPGHDVFSFRRARAGSCLRSESIIALYCAAPMYRPIDDLGRMRRMFEGSNVVLTAWDGDRLVGVLRGVTDGAYTTYVCDLAVHPDYQRSGIGHELLERVVSTYPESGVVLQAARIASDYYSHIGWQKVETGGSIHAPAGHFQRSIPSESNRFVISPAVVVVQVGWPYGRCGRRPGSCDGAAVRFSSHWNSQRRPANVSRCRVRELWPVRV